MNWRGENAVIRFNEPRTHAKPRGRTTSRSRSCAEVRSLVHLLIGVRILPHSWEAGQWRWVGRQDHFLVPRMADGVPPSGGCGRSRKGLDFFRGQYYRTRQVPGTAAGGRRGGEGCMQRAGGSGRGAPAPTTMVAEVH